MKFALIGMIVTLCVTCFSIVGCQQDETETSMEQLPYLSLNSKTDFSHLSMEEWKTVQNAARRIDVVVKDGLFSIKQTSGSQVNMSEDLFEYFQDGIKNTNKEIRKQVKLSRKRSRYGGELEDEPKNYDCVAQSILAVYERMGVAIGDKLDWIEEQYGTEGVPFGEISIVMEHYFEGKEVSISPSLVPDKPTIVIFNGVDYGHAANLYVIEGGVVYYTDPQLGNHLYYKNLSEVLYLYEVESCK